MREGATRPGRCNEGIPAGATKRQFRGGLPTVCQAWMFPLSGPCRPHASSRRGWCSTPATTLAATDGIVGQLSVPHVLTAVKALATLAPAARGFGLDPGSARAPQRAIVRRCRTPLPSTRTILRSVLRALDAPIAPRRNVIRPSDSNHNPSHTMARPAAASKRRPRWTDRAPSKSRETIMRRELCPERPYENLRFSGAMGVPPSHPPRGSLPAGFLRPGRGEEPAVGGLLSASPLRQHVPRSRRANARRGDHRRHRRPTHPPRVFAFVKAASLPLRPPRRGGFGLDAGSARAPQRAIVRRCQTSTLPHTDGDDAGPVRRDSGAAQLVRVEKAGQPSGWPARANPHGRSRQSPGRAGAKRRTCGAG